MTEENAKKAGEKEEKQSLSQKDIDALLKGQGKGAAAGNPVGASGESPSKQNSRPGSFDFDKLGEGKTPQEKSRIDMLMDVAMNVKIELGRTRMSIEDILSLGEGSIIELDRLAGDPVDVLVNDKLVARGEVMVLDNNFSVRITEIIKPAGNVKT